MTHAVRIASVLLFAVPLPARAQSAPDPVRLADSLSKEIETAWIAGDNARLQGAKRMLDRAVTLYPRDALLLHYQGYTIYRLLQGQPEPSTDTKAVLQSEGMAALAASARIKPMPETYILRRSLLAQSITDAASAMVIAPQMAQELADAERIGKGNPRVSLVVGIGAFFTPSMYGGGEGVALDHLTRAEAFFKNDRPGTAMPAWGRAEVHAWLGVVHQKLGHADAARRAYQEALRLEPGFGWVSAVLLPGLEKGVQPFPGVL